jgi:hypothetical protein
MLKEAASALACCTRLESLSGARFYDPAVCLGLSHLHTLRGVHVDKVSFADIAAALPKLHTLVTFGQCEDPAQEAVFFTDLLPQLRVFHFNGGWPAAQHQPAITTVAPLPLLQELVWMPDDTIAPRAFVGARPTVLHAPYALISQCWLEGVDVPLDVGAASFLARVCDLRITTALDVDSLDPADVARVLRAAPQLRKFHNDRCVHGDASWLAPTAPTHPAFEGLVHSRLREFGIRPPRAGAQRISGSTPLDDKWAAHLRRRHFPRLCALVAGKGVYFATPLEGPLLETGSTAS